ncbi:hypothetical protein DL95DRAFT_483740 [Leptodontidium sp. 2 PMI_412]|nr:hypothetical protein DL95DRAFT_483740 [Leptodontidium sp. 2 PMI_412]
MERNTMSSAAEARRQIACVEFGDSEAFIPVPRSWDATTALTLCLDAACGPSECCRDCLRRSLLRSKAIENLKHTIAKNPSSVLSEPNTAHLQSPTLQSLQPLPQTRASNLPGHIVDNSAQLSSPNTNPNLQRFVSEPMTSHPYNIVSSFVPLSPLGPASTTMPTGSNIENSVKASHGSAISAFSHSRT